MTYFTSRKNKFAIDKTSDSPATRTTWITSTTGNKSSPAVGTITPFAGNGRFGSSGDGGPAINASFAFLSRISLDAAGNLYRHIRRLETERLIEETEPRALPGDDDERRIYFRLLPYGRRVLAAEVRRLRAIIAIAEANHVVAPAPA